MTDLVRAPVELAVIEFPGTRFNGEIVPAIEDLVDGGVITILDVVLVSKLADGSVVAMERGELPADDALAFVPLDGSLDGLLSADDIEQIARVLSLGSSAALVVWENTWARRLIGAVAGAGAQVVAHDRLDRDALPREPAVSVGR